MGDSACFKSDLTGRGHSRYPLSERYSLNAWNQEQENDDRKTEGSSEPEKPPSESWGALLKDFTQNATLHGIRYLTLDTRFVLRRLVWLLVVLLAFGVFIFYMVDRFQEFLRYKKNVSVEENYVDKMEFPAITICNQNPFRITVAANAGWYQIAKQLTKEDESQINLRKCYPNEFMCGTKDCIEKSRRCDSFPDCEDESDEVGCELCVRLVEKSASGNFQIPNVTSETFDLLERTYESNYPVYVRKDKDSPVFLYFDEGQARWTLSGKFGDNSNVIAWVKQNSSTPQSLTQPWTYLRTGLTGPLSFTCLNTSVYPPLASDSNTSTLDLESLYEDGAEPLKDFLQVCSWKGGKCGPEYFQRIITDMGVCYTFKTDDLFVRRSGPGFGLSITLNIEQFEYTKDPQTGVGIRVLLHKPEDVPLMQGRAFAISPGLNTMVAIEKTNVENLEPPWGSCSLKSLDYFDTYSVYTCQMDCENTLAREECGCRDINMPQRGSNDKPVCTVDQYVSCLHPKLTAMRKKVDACTCPTPCSETVYVPSLSFASISTDDDIIQSRRREEKFDVMHDRLQEAREISYRVLADKYRATMRMFRTVELGTSSMEWMLRGVRERLDDRLDSLTQLGDLVLRDCRDFSRQHHQTASYLRLGVLRAADAYRTYLSLQVGTVFTQFWDAVRQIEAGYSPTERAFLSTRTGRVRFTQYDTDITLHKPRILVDDVKLQVRDNITIDTRADLTAIVDENTTISVVDNVTLDIVRGEAFYADLRASATAGRVTGAYADVWLTDEDFWAHSSNVWIRFSVLRTAYQMAKTSLQRASGRLLEDLRATVLQLVDSDYRLMKELAEPLLQISRVECTWCMTPTNDALYDILRLRLLDFLDGPLKVTLDDLAKRLDDIYERVLLATINNSTLEDSLLSELLPRLVNDTEWLGHRADEQMVGVVIQAAQAVEELLRLLAPKCESELVKKVAEYTDVHHRITNSVEAMLERLTSYAAAFSKQEARYIERNLTLTKVAQEAGYDRLRAHIGTAATTTTNALHDASLLVSRVEEQVNMVNYWFMATANDSYLAENSLYWRGFNMQEAQFTLPPKSVVEAMVPSKETREYWNTAVSELLTMVENLAFHLGVLRTALTDAEAYVNGFVEGNAINEQFFKKNFLQMDVFYKALTDKRVKQQKAYEYPALLSEVGGLLGLLLGASCITLIELLDLIIYNCCVKCKERRSGQQRHHARPRYAQQRPSRRDVITHSGADRNSVYR